MFNKHSLNKTAICSVKINARMRVARNWGKNLMTLTFVRIRKKISKNGSLTLDIGRTVKIWHTLIIQSDFSKDDLACPFYI